MEIGVIDTPVKMCTMCLATLPLVAFYAKVDGKDGTTSRCTSCTREVSARYKQRFPEAHRARTRRYNYAKHGITIEYWDALLLSQGGACASCGQANTAQRNLHIDHDHDCCPGTYSCGRCIRGLLCSQCNTALGLLGDDLGRIERLSNYLKAATSGASD